jgi:hypothetical protein
VRFKRKEREAIFKQILTPLVVLFASASLVIAVPRATGESVSSIQPASGPLDPWQQNLNARIRFKNEQTIDPWQANLYARHAYDTRKDSVPSQRASSGGFSWDDAGIGAGLVFGTLLIGAASVATIRRHRRPIAH